MAKEITYEWISDGVNQEISSTLLPDIGLVTSGIVDLVNGKAVVECYYAGQPIIVTRNQDNTTAIGNLYIYTTNTIQQVSFEIRSTNINDNGSVFWQVVF